MSHCSFCGSEEINKAPLCQSCGALRYPVASSNTTASVSRQHKLKLTAAFAVAAITPGSFILLVLVGATHFNILPRK